MTKQEVIEKIGAFVHIPGMGCVGMLMDVISDTVIIESAMTGSKIPMMMSDFVRKIKNGSIILK